MSDSNDGFTYTSMTELEVDSGWFNFGCVK